MLTFVELHSGDIDPHVIGALECGFKTRNPALVSRLLDLKPTARILARSMGEGYDVGDIANSYEHWLPTLERYRLNIVAYEIANEVNHPSHNVDPAAWAAAVSGWLNNLGPHPVPLMTPGLTPFCRVDEWRQVLDSLFLPYRAVHYYWQQQGPLTALSDALAQAGNVAPARVICTELNSAAASPDYQPTIAQRAGECRTAITALAAAGVYGACLFALDPWFGEGDWTYSFDLETTQSILAAGQTAPKPKRVPKPKPPKESIPMTKDEVTAVARGLYFAAGATLESDREQIGLNPDAAISAAWQPRKHGPAVTAERQLDGGGAVQVFAFGFALHWDGTQTTELEL